MPKIDLSSYSLDELKARQKDVAKAVNSFEARKRAEALAKLEAAAKDAGFSLTELLGSKAAKAPSVPKYRHPENPTKTWSGRGRRPNWFVEALNDGASEADLLI